MRATTAPFELLGLKFPPPVMSALLSFCLSLRPEFETFAAAARRLANAAYFFAELSARGYRHEYESFVPGGWSPPGGNPVADFGNQSHLP
jgi:hypothetical protein